MIKKNLLEPLITITFHKAWLALLALMGLACGLWLQNFFVPDMGAGANEIIFSRQPLNTIFNHMKWPDQSPLYSICLHLWSVFGEHPAIIRSFNLIVELATLTLLFQLARHLSSNPQVWLGACLMMILSSSSLWIIRDGRMYGLMEMFNIISLISILSYFKTRKLFPLIVFTAAMALSIYNHFIAFWSGTFVYLFILTTIYFDEVKNKKVTLQWTEILKTHKKLLIATLALPILVLPQIARFFNYALSPRESPHDFGWVEATIHAVKKLVWFLFINTNVSAEQLGLLYPVILFCIIFLGVCAFTQIDQQKRILFGVMFFSGFLLIAQAYRMDLNSRYISYLRPLLFICLSVGAFEIKVSEAKKRSLSFYSIQFIRIAIFLVLLIACAWCVKKKLPEKPLSWTAVLQSLDRLHRPGTTYYMGGSTDIIRYTLDVHGFNQEIKPFWPGDSQRRAFARSVARGEDFAFIHYALPPSPTSRWMHKMLHKNNYQVTRVGEDIKASHYRSPEPRPILEKVPLDQKLQLQSGLRWLEKEMTSRKETSRHYDQVLEQAVVAKVTPTGELYRSKQYTSYGPGEGGVWRLSEQDWNVVETVSLTSQDELKHMIWAHPLQDHLLYIGFPKVKLTDKLTVTYGLADSGYAEGSGANVEMEVYIGNQKLEKLITKDERGWHQMEFRTETFKDQEKNLTFVLTTENQNRRHFCFRFDPVGLVLEEREAVDLKGKKLHEQIKNLIVYRTRHDGRRINPIKYDASRYSASQMHEEVDDQNLEGWVDQKWELGYWEWNIVGRTRQRSDGELKEGIWAHPMNNTTLHIASHDTHLGKTLKGYMGYTDHSIQNYSKDPISFQIVLDQKTVLEETVSRKPGWKTFEIPITGDERSLHIKIDAQVDTWAHFIFDLWSE